MLFNSTLFLIFFPIVVCLYYIIPDRFKNVFLLAASYYFYMSWNAEYALLILATTVVTYFSAILVGRSVRRKTVLALCLIFNLGLLIFFKYTGFLLNLFGGLVEVFGVRLALPVFDIVLPVGISFYTFQALGYMIDVYRGDVEPERNFLRYALFVSFFPQLVAGPIERSGRLISQLVPHKFDWDRFREGILLMLWGYFLKLVIADRTAVFVDTVYGDYRTYAGWYIIVATILFGIQIYCDFMGYTVIAVGAAKILGVDLTDNFNAPYLATTVADFWRRWHISLTSWFRDYLYFPLGGSRKGRVHKYINIMIVFLVSGLWHGASLAFVLWGGLNGLYQIIGEVLLPVRKKIREILHIKSDSVISGIVGGIVTFILVDFAWMFFRAGRLGESVDILRSMISGRNFGILTDGSSLYECGLDRPNIVALLLAVAVLLVADICKKRGVAVRKIIMKLHWTLRLIIIPVCVLIIILFGVYGPQYDEAAFIYFQF